MQRRERLRKQLLVPELGQICQDCHSYYRKRIVGQQLSLREYSRLRARFMPYCMDEFLIPLDSKLQEVTA